ncbi:MAG: class I tRNA ligase family protein, partial [Pseudomonadota bacterium]
EDDPAVLIDQYGADALRFTLAAMAAQGRDIKLSTQRVEGYRNFATKLWNAARFAEMNECMRVEGFDPAAVEQTINVWIRGRTEAARAATTEAIETYRFNDAANAVYEFVWGEFCDWYLELIKPTLNGDDQAAVAETRAMTAWVLDEILKLLHPFMPFLTEELWARTAEVGLARKAPLTLSAWPQSSGAIDAAAEAEIGWVIKLVSEVRSVRSEMNVPAGARTGLVLVNADREAAARAERNAETLKRLARLDAITDADAAPKGAAMLVVDGTDVALPLAGVIDMAAEQDRLTREIEKAASEIGKIDGKLANPNFVAKAPAAVVEENRERRANFEDQIARLSAALDRLKAAA